MSGIKKSLSIFFLIIMLFTSNASYAIDMMKLYKIDNTNKDYVSEKIDLYIIDKQHNVYKKDVENGEFYFQPKHMGQYLNGYSNIVLVREVDKNIYVFFKNQYGNERISQLILKKLKKYKLKPKKIKDKQIFEEFEKQAILLTETKNVDKYFTATKKYTQTVDVNNIIDETEYENHINIISDKTAFQSNLDKKFAGYIFKIENNYSKPLRIEDIKFYNVYTEEEAFKEVQRIATPLSHISSVLIGITAPITFGISLAALPLALAPVVAENAPVLKESKEFLSEKAESREIKPGEIIFLKAIASKGEAVSKIPYVQVTMQNPETGKKFYIDNKPELLKMYKK